MNDLCANRHGGNEQSVAAFAKGNRGQQRERVYNAIVESPNGLTCDELAAQWGVSRHRLSPRFSELKAQYRIWVCGQRKTPAGGFAGVHFAG
jgi:hypothetical protein